MADVEFVGIETGYDEQNGEAIVDVLFRSNDDNTYNVWFDVDIDVGMDGTTDLSRENFGLTVYNEGSMRFRTPVEKSKLPVDVEACVTINTVS